MGKKRKWNRGGKDHGAQRKKRRMEELEFIKSLDERCQIEAPPLGVNILALDQETCEERDITVHEKFEDLPLTKETQKALRENKFFVLREIQKATLGHSLAKRDVLGAARTGSGKTLCYVIPIVEVLFRQRWNIEDGLGALVISPTRELATQIFEVLRKVGIHHRFSAGLIMGGKKFSAEKRRILGMNILIATPGRLLQHMEETFGFNCDQLQLLILDEADRILDMGFQKQIESILEYLPASRQTLLFSATLSKSVTKLAKLSLRNPQYIKCLESAKPTPSKLIESYLCMDEENKFNFLWTFIRTHVKQKMMVFMTTRKQVRFTYEIVRKLQPGCPVAHIHGKMVQAKRMATYYDFAERKGGCVFFTTQVAARGLDFPDVDWVLVYDCPTDVQSYVHTVGRTARNFSRGNSLLVLLPSELKFLKRLEAKKITPKRMVVKPSKLKNVTGTIASLVAENKDFKYLGERAFVSYIRSVYLESDKEVFQPDKLNTLGLTKSMGLPGVPQIKGSNVSSGNARKNMSFAMQELLGLAPKKKRGDTHVDRLLAKGSAGVFAEHREKLRMEESDEEDDSFFEADGEVEEEIATIEEPEKKEPDVIQGTDGDDTFVKEAQELISQADPKDKVDDRVRVREKHQKERWAEKRARRAQANQFETEVTLGTIEGSGSEESGSESSSDAEQAPVSLEEQALAFLES